MNDETEILTAYHEAGHVVVGYAMGAEIESVQLYGEENEYLPERFGECRLNWQPVMNLDVSFERFSKMEIRQRQRITVLGGPVAEMIYRGEKLHPAHFVPWQNDWRKAWELCEGTVDDPVMRTRFLEHLIVMLFEQLSDDACWAAIAAVADELLAHEALDQDQLNQALSFWVR